MPNRFVLVDETGRVYDRTGLEITIVEQDEGQTLKVFVKPSPDAAQQKEKHELNPWFPSSKDLEELRNDIAEAMEKDWAWFKERFEKGL